MKLPVNPSPAALAAAREITFSVPSQKNDEERIQAWAEIIDRHMTVRPSLGEPIWDARNSEEPDEMLTRVERERRASEEAK